MAIIKCKMCGGDVKLPAEKTFGICEYCGSTMTFPKVEDDQRAAAFNRGNHFRRIGEFDKALAVYERIVQEDNADAEAHWCCALCRFGIEYVEDPSTYEWLPTCHRASFDSFLEDVDYLAAVEYSDGITCRQYQKDAAKIAEIQRRILVTSQSEDPFDVFICYKETDESGSRTVDSTLAQDIYYQLTGQGRRVFFARITLEDKAGAEYEPYIFAALNSAKVMVAVGTRPEHFNAVWVKNEWSRYLALMKKDRNRLLIPCYRDMNPYDLPEQLSVLQSYDMGKIGFIQDLIRGIGKVLDADKAVPVPDSMKKTVVAQNEGGSNLSALIKRGNMALEDGEWDRADGFFEQALNVDAECGAAYFGKALAEKRCASAKLFIQRELGVTPQTENLTACEEDTERIEAVVKQYEVSGYLDGEDIRRAFHDLERTYPSATTFWKNQLDYDMYYFKNDKLMGRAIRYVEGELAEQIHSVVDNICAEIQMRIERAQARDQKNIETVRKTYQVALAETEQQIAEQYERAVERQNEDIRQQKVVVLYEEKLFLKKEFANLEGCLGVGKRLKEIKARLAVIDT